jgi:hypothetical protein
MIETALAAMESQGATIRRDLPSIGLREVVERSGLGNIGDLRGIGIRMSKKVILTLPRASVRDPARTTVLACQ